MTRHRCVRVAGLLAVLVLAGGCVKADVHLTVRADDRVDGTIVMAVDRSFLPSDPAGADALLAEVRQRTYAGTPSGATRQPYADAQYVGSQVIIREMSLLDFDRGTAGSGLKIVHQDHRFQLSGTIDTVAMAPPAGTPPTATARRMADSFTVQVVVTFPGRVLRSNGRASGNTVSWRPKLGQRIDLSAEAEDGAGPDWSWAAFGLVALGAAAAVALVLRPRLAALRGR